MNWNDEIEHLKRQLADVRNEVRLLRRVLSIVGGLFAFAIPLAAQLLSGSIDAKVSAEAQRTVTIQVAALRAEHRADISELRGGLNVRAE